jgi:hypothetical protein
MHQEEADRSYCEKYTGREGGANATDRAIYPFMKEVINSMQFDCVAKHYIICVICVIRFSPT